MTVNVHISKETEKELNMKFDEIIERLDNACDSEFIQENTDAVIDLLIDAKAELITCRCNKVCDHNKFGFENCGNYIPMVSKTESEKEKLTELIQNAVDGCARNWAEVIADHLLANGVIVLPCGKGTKLKYDGIDYEVDHWNILASAFSDKAKEEGKSSLHLFDVEEAYKALKGVE